MIVQNSVEELDKIHYGVPKIEFLLHIYFNFSAHIGQQKHVFVSVKIKFSHINNMKQPRYLFRTPNDTVFSNICK